MLERRIIKISFVIAMVAFCLNLTFMLHAEESCEVDFATSTDPGNADYSNMETLQFDPDNPDEIECGTDITIAVIGGLPPLDWEVSDNHYSLIEGEDERTYTLSCTGCPCDEDWDAVATVTVTDSSEPENIVITTKIRNVTDEAADWIEQGHYCGLSGQSEDDPYYECTNCTGCGNYNTRYTWTLIEEDKKQEHTVEYCRYYSGECGVDQNCIDMSDCDKYGYASVKIPGSGLDIGQIDGIMLIVAPAYKMKGVMICLAH